MPHRVTSFSVAVSSRALHYCTQIDYLRLHMTCEKQEASGSYIYNMVASTVKNVYIKKKVFKVILLLQQTAG